MRNEKLKFGLVLGGGGARGFAHVGVLKVLERAGIAIDLLVGTSMGGIIGASYAAGLSVEQIEQELLAMSGRSSVASMVDFRPTGRGLVRGDRMHDYIANAIGKEITFEDLAIPLAMVAVDARSGCEVLLNNGNIADAIRATMSVPIVLAPVEREDMILVDGGVLNNVPVDIAREMGADIVVAVDVMPDFSRNTPGQPLVEPAINPPMMPEFMKDAFHYLYLMISAMTRLRLAENPPDVLVRPNVPPEIDLLFGHEHAAEIIAVGEVAAEAALPRILELLASA